MDAEREEERTALVALLGAPPNATDVDLAFSNAKKVLCQPCRDNQRQLLAWRTRILDEHRRQHADDPQPSPATEKELVQAGELITRDGRQAGALRRIRNRLEAAVPDEFGVYQGISVGTPSRYESPDLVVASSEWETSGRVIARLDETALAVQLAADAMHAEHIAGWFTDIGVTNLLIVHHVDGSWQLHIRSGHEQQRVLRGGYDATIGLPHPMTPISASGLFIEHF